MSAKYTWKWQSDARWSRSPAALVRHRFGGQPDTMCRRRVTKRGDVDVGYVCPAAVARALRNFAKCQCAALAVDMGVRSRASVQRVEQCASTSLPVVGKMAGAERSVRLARAMMVASSVGYLGPVAGAAVALRLRTRRAGETPPPKLLESFLSAYLPRR